MGLKRTNEFRQDAVCIALTSGLTRKQVADDFGVGISTLNKWITAHCPSTPGPEKYLAFRRRLIPLNDPLR
jgi:transposase-like protein